MDKLRSPRVFLHRTKGLNLPHRKQIRRFIESIFRTEKVNLAELHYNFCSDHEIRSLNAQWLGHDHVTDVLTFNYAPPGMPVSGDIFLGAAEIRRNARRYGSTIGEEMMRVMFHGALHLSGYADKSKSQKRVMRQKEDHYLGLFAAGKRRIVPRGTLRAR
jgi:probable rRNA maturation factor